VLLFAGATAAQVGANKTLLDPNIASREDLSKVPHFDAELVEALLAERPFLTMSALDKKLRGTLAAEQLAEVYAKLWVAIDLNAATREEILLIPGVGKKMAHEFEEYRPYDGLPRFRREMLKYVDEKEVARLEQYVYLRLDLNTATAEDFATIPGVGEKMIHKFLEYRPYTDMAQFRREIGKYADAKEVARLERYMKLEPAADAAPLEAPPKDTPKD
jgi:DNA uptake protein ComE-like DNA-binding protein